MPELPDVELYRHALKSHVDGQVLERVRIVNPFLLRSVDPPLSAAHGRRVVDVLRLGKRIVFEMEDELFLVIHLMISGRLRRRAKDAKISRKVGHAGFDFPEATILFTEASSKKRASLHVVAGRDGLADHDRGGREIDDLDADGFAELMRVENHTLKRCLTDPHLFSGIGNAYSDEILHDARLSPIKWSQKLDDAEVERLFVSTQKVLAMWTRRLRDELGDDFPDKVTAFRPEMAVHGKYGEPCPTCETKVQRIRHAENEINYCPTCQTGGKLLADRGLSRLLRKDWPKNLAELEERVERLRDG